MEQIYGAGVVSTANTIKWVLLYMCLYPDKEAKVHEEIDREIGKYDRVKHFAASSASKPDGKTGILCGT